MVNRNIMDVDKVESIVDKLRIYKNEESVISEDMNSEFGKLLNNYKTDNTDEMEELFKEINNKFKKVLKIHNDNMVVLSKNCATYRDTASNVIRNFDNS